MSSVAATSDEPSFWRRQFAPKPSAEQIFFDLAFGIALPVLCLAFDPIVFRASTGGPLLGRQAVAAGVAIGLGMLSLSTWLLIRWPPALFAGLLVGGATFAALLGLVLLPFSLIGLFILIGVLGFSPFLTAFVFWRNAVRAYRRACAHGAEARSLALAAVGVAVACVGPLAAGWYVTREMSRATDMVVSPDPAQATQGLAQLRRFRGLGSFDRLVLAYEAEKEAGRRERLAASYKELTGEEIEHRLATLRD
jgi:hypothetical protein